MTRKGSNLYKVDGKDVWIETRYCYEYGYYEDAVLTRNKLVFLNSGTSCDVKRGLQANQVPSGTYEVMVTRDESDFYSTSDGFIFQTNYCFEFAMMEEAIFRSNGYGGGKIIFVDAGDSCDVERVFTEVRL